MHTTTIDVLWQTASKHWCYVWQRPRQSVGTFEIRSEEFWDRMPKSMHYTDSLGYLITQIYGREFGDTVPISNVRLFTLALLYDWCCLVYNVEPCISSLWSMGRTCVYPVDYYHYFVLNRALHNDFDRDIWLAKNQVLFQISFRHNTPIEIYPEQMANIKRVQSLVTRVTSKYNVDLTESRIPGPNWRIYKSKKSKNEFKNGLFCQIDKDLLDYMLALDPFLFDIELDQDLGLEDYADKYRQPYMASYLESTQGIPGLAE